jgi:hypothetical protein
MDDEQDFFDHPDSLTAECQQCRLEARYSMRENSVPCVSCGAAIDTAAIRDRWYNSMEQFDTIMESGDEETIAVVSDMIHEAFEAVMSGRELEYGFLEKHATQLYALIASRDASSN